MKKGETNLIFDINKISEFVFGDADKRTSEVEITENFIYDKDENKMIHDQSIVKSEIPLHGFYYNRSMILCSFQYLPILTILQKFQL